MKKTLFNDDIKIEINSCNKKIVVKENKIIKLPHDLQTSHYYMLKLLIITLRQN